MNTDKLVKKLAVDYLNEGMKGYYENGANTKEMIKLYEYKETINGKDCNVIKQLVIYLNGYQVIFNRIFPVKTNVIRSDSRPKVKVRGREKYPRVRRRNIKN